MKLETIYGKTVILLTPAGEFSIEFGDIHWFADGGPMYITDGDGNVWPWCNIIRISMPT